MSLTYYDFFMIFPLPKENRKKKWSLILSLILYLHYWSRNLTERKSIILCLYNSMTVLNQTLFMDVNPETFHILAARFWNRSTRPCEDFEIEMECSEVCIEFELHDLLCITNQWDNFPNHTSLPHCNVYMFPNCTGSFMSLYW